MKNEKLITERVNCGERSAIAIPIERNRGGSHNIAINMDFDLSLNKVYISEEGTKQ